MQASLTKPEHSGGPVASSLPYYTLYPSSPFTSHRPSSMLMASAVHSSDVSLPCRNPEEKGQKKKKSKSSLLLFSPWPPLVCCPAGCDPWPLGPHSWPLDLFPRHTFLCPPCHGNILVTAAATVTDGQGPGNNFIQAYPVELSIMDNLPLPFLAHTSLFSLSHTRTWTHTAPPSLLWHPLSHIQIVQFPWILPLSRVLWITGPDRVINTEILDSPWHVHGTYMGIRISCHCWHGKVHKKVPQRHPHFTPTVFMVQGLGAPISSPCCNYLSLLLVLLFSHILWWKEGSGWRETVVKTQSQAAGDLFANLETNGALNGIAEELNKVQQENELQQFHC